MDGVQPLLDALQLVGGIGERIDLVAHLLRRVLHLVHEVGHRGVELGERFVIARQTGEGTLRLRQKRGRTLRLVVAVQAERRVMQAVRELFRVLHELAPGFQRLVLARRERGARDLVNLEFEALHPAELFALVHGKPVDLALQGLHSLILRSILLQKRLVAGKAVQKRQVGRLVKQGSRVVLPVDVDEAQAELFERTDRHRYAVYAAVVLAVEIDLPADGQLIFKRHAVVRKPRKLRHAVKDGAHRSLVFSRADHIAVGALAQNGGDRVDHDGLARTRFTGQDIEAVLKQDVRLLDHGDILDMEQTEHGRFPS